MSRRLIPLLKWVTILFIFTVSAAVAVPYSAIVIDADTGEVLYEDNADEFSHPAGLTKLMTLYAAFDAVETGLIGLDDKIRISLKACHEPPVKLGLREGQRIKFRYLLRAAAVGGANDASTSIAEAIDGSEEAFAIRMNGYSAELGLPNANWSNAHGLTQKGNTATARDIARLFAAHARDFPTYFNLFSRKKTHAGLREVKNSSLLMLENVEGITGAKSGYSRAARFSSAVYVQRRDKKVVGVILGAITTKALIRKMNVILDEAFADAE